VIDFHCHLDLYPDPQGIADECVARNLHVLSVTTTPSAWVRTSALARGAARVRTGLGLHPQLAHERISELPLFERILGDAHYVGEIGLDGAPEFKRYWTDQMTVFTRILDACQAAGGRILSIHSRRAATAVLDTLETRRRAGTPVLHWFSGNTRELIRAVELGCWFSVGSVMLDSERGRSLAANMPRDRILTETDGPFAQIEGQVTLPWHVDQTVTRLATVWGLSAQNVGQQLMANLKRLVEGA
jgi:TatD DNase family protein